jgi:glutamine synthetase
MSPSWPNTVLNTIVAEAIEDLTGKLQTALKSSRGDLEKAVSKVVKDSYAANKQVVFNGDNYADAWHVEAEKRGLANLRTTPDALPAMVDKTTVALFKKYKVLSKRELDSRYEVAAEQYSTILNIEGETAASIARTMILPAAARYLAELKAAELTGVADSAAALTEELIFALDKLDEANEHHPDVEGLKHAIYMRDKVIPAMDDVRDVADRLEKVVADDLWPLPKYSEMLFIK